MIPNAALLQRPIVPTSTQPAGPTAAGDRFARRRKSGEAGAELNAAQQSLLVAAVAALHALALWAVLQVPAVRNAVRESVPLFVDILAPEAPPAAPRPPPPPRQPPNVTPPREPPLITSTAPAQAPAETFVAEPAPIEPAPATPAPVVETAPQQPKVIPSSGVQYLTPPPLEYPRASRRLGEAGKVLVRVYIDEDGLPRNAQVTQSSGHARLDEAALAAVHKARFKPYTENGRASAGWAFIPLTFNLER